MKTAAICLVTFFLIANPLAVLSQDEELARPLDGREWEIYKPNEDDDEELKIRREIVVTAMEELAVKRIRFDEGQSQIFVLLHAYQRMQESMEAVYADNKVELIKAATDVLNAAMATEENQVLRSNAFNAGMARPDEVAEAKAFRLRCELRLLQLEKESKERMDRETKLPRKVAKLI